MHLELQANMSTRPENPRRVVDSKLSDNVCPLLRHPQLLSPSSRIDFPELGSTCLVPRMSRMVARTGGCGHGSTATRHRERVLCRVNSVGGKTGFNRGGLENTFFNV
jgi:hypothetical protein